MNFAKLPDPEVAQGYDWNEGKTKEGAVQAEITRRRRAVAELAESQAQLTARAIHTQTLTREIDNTTAPPQYEPDRRQDRNLHHNSRHRGHTRDDSVLEIEVDPFRIRFTHDQIADTFRNGRAIDEVIQQMYMGRETATLFPPLHVVRWGWKRYSLSNRRLFVLRALHRLGCGTLIAMHTFQANSWRVQRLKWDSRLGSMATKWTRAFTSKTDGQMVRMRGRGSSHTHLVNGHGGTRDVPPVNEGLRRDVQTQELQPVGLAFMEGARRRPPLSERMVEEAEDALGVDGLS